jgi:hypothetical protein
MSIASRKLIDDVFLSFGHSLRWAILMNVGRGEENIIHDVIQVTSQYLDTGEVVANSLPVVLPVGIHGAISGDFQ